MGRSNQQDWAICNIPFNIRSNLDVSNWKTTFPQFDTFWYIYIYVITSKTTIFIDVHYSFQKTCSHSFPAAKKISLRRNTVLQEVPGSRKDVLSFHQAALASAEPWDYELMRIFGREKWWKLAIMRLSYVIHLSDLLQFFGDHESNRSFWFSGSSGGIFDGGWHEV